jgi:hypothetical protein
MIKRAVRFATLMFAISAPLWLSWQESTGQQAHASGAEALTPMLPSAEGTQATAANAMTTQSFWHLMALSSR